MSEVTYLTVEDALSVVRRFDLGSVRDIGLLDAALARPRAVFFGHEAYAAPATKAAALFESLATARCLHDGNKRLAVVMTLAFLHQNDLVAEVAHEALYGLLGEVARGGMELSVIEDRLRIRPLSA